MAASHHSPRLLTRSTRFVFQREQMSLNCSHIPFRFTIMAAARTAWKGFGRGPLETAKRCPETASHNLS